MPTITINSDPNHASKPKKAKPFQKINWKNIFRKGYKLLVQLIKVMAKVIVGAILYVALFHFVPELREYIPSLENFAIWILEIAEHLFSFVTKFLGC